jgi:hypothetical protein
VPQRTTADIDAPKAARLCELAAFLDELTQLSAGFKNWAVYHSFGWLYSISNLNIQGESVAFPHTTTIDKTTAKPYIL